MRAWLMAALIMIAGLGICSAVCASLPYDADVTAVKSTTIPNTWIYTMHNTSASQEYTLWLIGLEVDEQTEVLNTVTPVGWSVDTDSQPHFITWMYYAGEIEAGGTQTGFQAQFTCAPAFQNFTALMSNNETGEAPTVDGIVTLPEPAGIAILLTGLAPLVAFTLRRRPRG